jgi:hypothetical protein
LRALAIKEMASRRYVSPFATMVVYLGLGDKERALAGLDQAYQARSWMMIWLNVDRIFDRSGPSRVSSRC